MITPIEINRPPSLTDLDQADLADYTERVLKGHLLGFVVDAAVPDAYERVINHALDIRLEGGVNTTTMTFNYDTTVSGLSVARTEGRTPEPEEWERFGVTPLHSDGEENDEMLSISKAKIGAYTIHILRRGPNRSGDMPIELWDTLQIENTRLLLDGVVDADNLLPEMTSLDVCAGDTVVFNPSQPHMGITTLAPRRADTTFFQRAS